MKKGINQIFESFEDKKAVIIVGFLCFFYLTVSYFPETGVIAKILPPWPLKFFTAIALLTLITQLMVWKALRHYSKGWYRHPGTLILLICEFMLALFTVLLVSWPVYSVYHYFATPRAH